MAYDFEQDPYYQEFLRQRNAMAQRTQQAIPTAPAPAPASTEPPDRTWGQALGDTALSLGRAALGVPKAFTDIGQLVPIVSEVADPLSRGLGRAQESLAAQMSPEAQANRAALGRAIEAGDIGGTLAAGVQPSNLVDLLGQLGSSLVGMKGLDKLLAMRKGYAALQPFTRAGIAEGAITGGSVASDIAGQEGGWTPERLLGIPAGAVTGAIGGLSAKMLPSDIDIGMLMGRQATANLAGGQTSGSLLSRMARGALQEGLVEEFPQSVQESFWSQLGTTGDPSLDRALAEGALGGVLGGIAGGVFNATQPQAQPPAAPDYLAALGGLSGRGGANAPLVPPGFGAPPAAAIPAQNLTAIQNQELINRIMQTEGRLQQPIKGIAEQRTGFIPPRADVGAINDRLSALAQERATAEQEIRSMLAWREFLKGSPYLSILDDRLNDYRYLLQTNEQERTALMQQQMQPPAAPAPAAPAPAAPAPAAPAPAVAPAVAPETPKIDYTKVKTFSMSPGAVTDPTKPRDVTLYDAEGNVLGRETFAPKQFGLLAKKNKWTLRTEPAAEVTPPAPAAEVTPPAPAAEVTPPVRMTLKEVSEALTPMSKRIQDAEAAKDFAALDGIVQELDAMGPSIAALENELSAPQFRLINGPQQRLLNQAKEARQKVRTAVGTKKAAVTTPETPTMRVLPVTTLENASEQLDTWFKDTQTANTDEEWAKLAERVKTIRNTLGIGVRAREATKKPVNDKLKEIEKAIAARANPEAGVKKSPEKATLTPSSVSSAEGSVSQKPLSKSQQKQARREKIAAERMATEQQRAAEQKETATRIAEEDTKVAAAEKPQLMAFIEAANIGETPTTGDFQPVRDSVANINRITKQIDTATAELPIGVAIVQLQEGKVQRVKGSTKAEAMDAAAVDAKIAELDGLFTELNKAFVQLEEAVGDGDAAKGRILINRYQRAAKSAGRETSPAIRLSMHYSAYQNGTLRANVITDNEIRLTNEEKRKIREEGRTDADKAALIAKEKLGEPTALTQLGRKLLGLTIAGKGGERVLADELKAAKDALTSGENNTITEAEAIQARGLSLLLHEFSITGRTGIERVLAEQLRKILKESGALYRIRVEYFPWQKTNNSATESKGRIAEYDPMTNTIKIYGDGANPRAILHEVIHAATVRYISDNQDSEAAKKLMAIARKLGDKILANPKAYGFTEDRNGFATVLAAQAKNPTDTRANLVAALELLSHGLTDPATQTALQNITSTPETKVDQGAFKAVKSLWRAFTDVLKKILGFGAQIDNTAFGDFLDAYNIVMGESAKAGKFGRPNKINLAPLAATNAENMEAAMRRDDEIRKADLKAKVQGNVTPESAGVSPQAIRAATEANSPITKLMLQRLAEAKSRAPYAKFDAFAKQLLSWIPKQTKQKFGQSGEVVDVDKALTDFVIAHPKLGLAAINLIDNFMVPQAVKANKFNKDKTMNYVDNTAVDVANSNIAELPNANQEGFDYLNDPAKTPKDFRVKKLVDAYREQLAEARRLGILPPELDNAPDSELIKWLLGPQYPYIRGYKFGVTKDFFTSHNGYRTTATTIIMPNEELENPRLNAWIKEVVVNGNKDYVMVFIDGRLSPQEQDAELRARSLVGFERLPYNYYKVSSGAAGNPDVFRFKTFDEMKQEQKDTLFLRSMAATTQEMAHRIAGIKFAAELVADNAAEPDFDKRYAHEATAANLEKLAEQVGADKIFNFADAKTMENPKALRTPGNWVVLKGTKWGALNEYVVPATVYAALDDYNNSQMLTPKSLRTLNRWWKKNMTVYSMMAWANNIMSSFILSYYNDITPSNIKRALDLIYRVKYGEKFGAKATEQERALVEEFERSGAMFGTLTVGEELQVVMRTQSEALGNPDDTTRSHLEVARAMFESAWDVIKRNANGLDQRLSDFYANQDNVFRFAAYMTHIETQLRNNGGKALNEAEIEKAAKWAADVMVNYDINAKWINMARQTALPFLAWPYRIFPQLARLVVEKPWKIANTLGMIAIVDALAYAMLGGADDREEQERGVLYEYMKENIWGLPFAPAYVRMPFGDEGQGTFFGLGRLIPLGDLTLMQDGAIVPQTLSPGGPLAIAAQLLFNYDAFRQEALRDEAKTFGENTSNSLSFIYRSAMPATITKVYNPFAVGDGWFGKVVNDKRGPLGSEANAWVETARLLGFNFRSVDFSEAAYTQSQADKVLRQKIKTNARKAINSELRYGTPDIDEINDAYEQMFALIDQSYEDRGYAMD